MKAESKGKENMDLIFAKVRPCQLLPVDVCIMFRLLNSLVFFSSTTINRHPQSLENLQMLPLAA